MNKTRYSLEIKFSEEDDCYLGRCPELAPFVNMGGAIAHGDTWEEAARETAIAAQLIVDALTERGEPLPTPCLYSE